jgi:hypothetical protein
LLGEQQVSSIIETAFLQGARQKTHPTIFAADLARFGKAGYYYSRISSQTNSQYQRNNFKGTQPL